MSAPMNVLAVLDAAFDDCVWLRKNSIRTMWLEPDTIAEARAAVVELIEAAKKATELVMHDGASSREACERLVAAIARVQGVES